MHIYGIFEEHRFRKSAWKYIYYIVSYSNLLLPGLRYHEVASVKLNELIIDKWVSNKENRRFLWIRFIYWTRDCLVWRLLVYRDKKKLCRTHADWAFYNADSALHFVLIVSIHYCCTFEFTTSSTVKKALLSTGTGHLCFDPHILRKYETRIYVVFTGVLQDRGNELA